MNWRRILCLASTLTFGSLIACTGESEPEGEEDVEVSEAALFGLGCSPDEMIPKAPDATRRAILERAARWVRDPVPYSMTQVKREDGKNYRTDCSGFVSMAWGGGTGMTTADVPPRTTSQAIAKQIAWEDLKPGDAINRPPKDSVSYVNATSQWINDVTGELLPDIPEIPLVGHIRLFAGRTSIGSYCFWEQTSGIITSGTTTGTFTKAATEAEGYVPIRKKGLN